MPKLFLLKIGCSEHTSPSCSENVLFSLGEMNGMPLLLKSTLGFFRNRELILSHNQIISLSQQLIKVQSFTYWPTSGVCQSFVVYWFYHGQVRSNAMLWLKFSFPHVIDCFMSSEINSHSQPFSVSVENFPPRSIRVFLFLLSCWSSFSSLHPSHLSKLRYKIQGLQIFSFFKAFLFLLLYVLCTVFVPGNVYLGGHMETRGQLCGVPFLPWDPGIKLRFSVLCCKCLPPLSLLTDPLSLDVGPRDSRILS